MSYVELVWMWTIEYQHLLQDTLCQNLWMPWSIWVTGHNALSWILILITSARHRYSHSASQFCCLSVEVWFTRRRDMAAAWLHDLVSRAGSSKPLPSVLEWVWLLFQGSSWPKSFGCRLWRLLGWPGWLASWWSLGWSDMTKWRLFIDALGIILGHRFAKRILSNQAKNYQIIQYIYI